MRRSTSESALDPQWCRLRSFMVPRFAIGAITPTTPMTARPTDITGLAGSRAACSSARGPGTGVTTAGVIITAATDITVVTGIMAVTGAATEVTPTGVDTAERGRPMARVGLV